MIAANQGIGYLGGLTELPVLQKNPKTHVTLNTKTEFAYLVVSFSSS